MLCRYIHYRGINLFFSNNIKYQKLGEMILETKQSSKCIINIKNPYQLQVGEILVEMRYSKSNKKIDECMLNILKQKHKMG